MIGAEETEDLLKQLGRTSSGSELLNQTILNEGFGRSVLSTKTYGIKSILDETKYIDIDRLSDERTQEVARMETPVPPWGMIILKGPSIENIRRSYFEYRSRGAVLFDMRLDTFKPGSTPESRARFGVQLMQIASFLKGSAMASLRSERFGGIIPSNHLSEESRASYLETIASKGFAWVEVDTDIEAVKRAEIIACARSAGSKVMLAHRLEEMMEWTPPEDTDPEDIDGYKVLVPIRDSSSMKRAIRASRNIRHWMENRMVIIEPVGSTGGIQSILSPLSISDLVSMEPRELMDGNDTSALNPPFPGRLNVWNSLGLLGDGMDRDWSMKEKQLTPETGLYLQVGNLESYDFRSRIFNSQFNLLSLDAMMVPWTCELKDLSVQLTTAARMGMKGLFVEMPLRGSAVGSMDWTDPRSSLVGSIDVVSFRGGRTCGFNSEVYGLGDQIHASGIEKGSKALVLGTGASGRAAAAASTMMGMETYIAGNNPERTRDVALKLQGGIKGTSFKSLNRPGVKFDLVINSVPFETRTVGGGKNSTMEIVEIVRGMEPSYGMDLYYRVQWTPFLSSIESRGGIPVSGIDILLKSSLRAFNLLTGTDGLESSMRKVFEDTLLN